MESSEVPRQFVLQAIDPEMDCPVLEARFQVDDLSKLRAILVGGPDRDPDLRGAYSLEGRQLTTIVSAFNVAFDPGGRPAVIVPWHSIREAPYLVHTGFELPLMLDGRKQLAFFADIYPSNPDEDEIIPERRFQSFVDTGHLTKKVIATRLSKPQQLRNRHTIEGTRVVYYARKGEEWRIDAHLLLIDVAHKAGWNDALERYEGALLGYDDWQNDWWIERRRARREIAQSGGA